MDRNIVKYQQDALKALSGKIDSFYLAGGTALSVFYFQHRLSVDLDFFTDNFVYGKIEQIMARLGETLGKKVSLEGQRLGEDMAKMVVYNVQFTAKTFLKIDFVEDFVKLLKKTKVVDGIHILSLEDIYMRKLYALAGMVKTFDETGRSKFLGGRADAKDFYDVFYLSHTFTPLSEFAVKYCNQAMMEAIIKWYRTFDRMAMMDGILTLAINKTADYKAMEKHFKTEIDKLIGHELGGL